ncbi:MAG TPA: PAS domain-containing sensor histidine kinase [Deltaproteobacteria bacterium]|nr:PAS domain-containing sensor histidine kinase [Deltaproteobacteria bacterium]
MTDAALLDAIVREMHTGVVVIDSSRRVVHANPFFIESFRVAGEPRGKLLDAIIGDGAVSGAVDRFIDSGAIPEGKIDFCEGGRFYKVRFVPLRGDDGARLVLFLQDVTEEKRVEAIKKDFVANVSHELRTPLASIKGYSETLLDGAVEDRRTLSEFLRIIDRHATRMTRLIEDLLTLSRLESQPLVMDSRPVDMGEVITASAAGFAKQAADKGIGLAVSVPPGLPTVCCDRDRIEQVLVNLLDNAIKYTPNGGSVEVSARDDGACVRVEVRDTGIGIPAGDIPRIFERFYRVDKARSRAMGGTGLGLAIVKHIIQAHDGTVSVESAPGEGSTFAFTLKRGSGDCC